MGAVVVILIIACVVSAKFRAQVFSFILGIAIFGLIVYLAIKNFSSLWPILLVGAGVIIVVGVIMSIIEDSQDKKAIAEWISQPSKPWTSPDVEKFISSFIKDISENDTNPKYKYDYNSSSIPYGRANCFLNYFDSSIDIEEPIYYSPIRSKDKVELREYGLAMTSGGIYISQQLDKKDQNENYKTTLVELPFKGLFKISYSSENELTVRYSDMKKVSIKKEQTTVSLAALKNVLSSVIESGLPLSILQDNIADSDNDTFDYEARLKEADKVFKKNLSMRDLGDSAVDAGTVGSMPNMLNQFKEYSYKFGERQGHGIAAEYAGNVFDKVTGKSVENVGVSNEKGGADRLINGVQIQTKYCATATDTINAGLNGEYIQNGMILEVPRDQYNECVKQLSQKMNISEAEARKYVKKGILTYNQALNAAKAGSIEGLAIDTVNGIVCSAASGSITALFTFAISVWRGAEPKEAAKQSLVVAAKVIGKSTAIYVFTMQASRSKLIFHKTVLKNGKKVAVYFNNPLYKLGDGLAKKISTSSVAKSSIGKKMKLDQMTGQKVVAGGLLIAISYGPDIARALVGRISPKQLFKNAAVTTAGFAGAAIGNAALPIVGGIIGGMVGGFVSKAVLDQFIEDDAVEMYELLREEFIDVVMMSNLDQNEFSSIVGIIFENPKLPHVLRDMYAYGDSREYAREHLVNPAVVGLMEKRSRITEDMIDIAFSDMTEELVEEDSEGTAVAEAVQSDVLPSYCPSCGNKYDEGAIFCKKCGTKRVN